MDKKELDEGMKKADEKKDAEKKDADGKKGGKDEPDGGKKEGGDKWSPSFDWIKDSGLGYFINNNRGLGELLVDKLNESGVDTEMEALNSLVKVLQEFSREYRELGETLGDNISKIDKLSGDSEDLAKAIKDLVKELGGDTSDSGVPPPIDDIGMDAGMDTGAMPPPDMGAGMDAGGMPPPDMGAGMDAGAMPPPDMGAGMGAGAGAMPPADMGAGGMPPPVDMSNPSEGGLVASDERIKDVPDIGKYVLSDERLKSVAGSLAGAMRKRSAAKMRQKAPKAQKLSGRVIDACLRKD